MSTDREYMRRYMTARYHRRRKEIIERLGGKCSCGGTDDLQIDHKDPKQKEVNIARRLAGLSKEKLEKEIGKCQLLCRKCHEDKSIAERGQQRARHGTLSGYRYCKCEECREARSRYGREHKIRVRSSTGSSNRPLP